MIEWISEHRVASVILAAWIIFEATAIVKRALDGGRGLKGADESEKDKSDGSP
jgi:hypothetical protein